MKIAVICANGKAGQLIVKEAVNRGFDVTAVVKGENKSAAQNAIVKDLFDLTAADLAGFDAVVDAFGAWTPETLDQHSTSLKHICDVLSGTDTRLFVVGGAGSLYVNAEHTACVLDGADFPEIFKPLANAMAKALRELRERNDVKCAVMGGRIFDEERQFTVFSLVHDMPSAVIEQEARVLHAAENVCVVRDA